MLSLIGLKNLWEKEKILVTSSFSLPMFSKGFLHRVINSTDCVLIEKTLSLKAFADDNSTLYQTTKF